MEGAPLTDEAGSCFIGQAQAWALPCCAFGFWLGVQKQNIKKKQEQQQKLAINY